MDKVQLKTFAFGAVSIGLLWAGMALKGSTDNLHQAHLEIDSARTLLQLIKTDIISARTDVDSTRRYLSIMKGAAIDAKNELGNLQKERDVIYKNINSTIEATKRKLKDHETSIEGILHKQKAMLDSLNASPIKNIVIEPSKSTNQ